MATAPANCYWPGCDAEKTGHRAMREWDRPLLDERGAQGVDDGRAADSAARPWAGFIEAAQQLGVTVNTGEPLARHTTFRVGGPADLYASVNRPDLLAALADLAETHGIPALVLGGGSNMLVSDAGVRGLVIANACREIRLAEDESTANGASEVIAAAGAPLAGLARWCIRAGLAGLEWAVSVPGTVGGAVVGNAGAYGGDVAGSLAWAEVAYPGDGGSHDRRRLTGADLEYAYRTSTLKREIAVRALSVGALPFGRAAPIVLAAAFHLTRGDVAAMTAIADRYLEQRRASQPVEPSAGSIFRNPPGDHAGRLVEAAGLKGYQIGGAQISLRHANFIINAGAARAADVLALIRLAQQRVAEMTGIGLETEILRIGDWT
jgi:UDP-N-acetylmuramate dehydrogenase